VVAGLSSPSTAPRSSTHCSRPRFSGSKNARPRACEAGAGSSRQASGGTLLRDEVSYVTLSAQAKLLRVLQDLAVERVGGHGTRRIDTRIVAATNRPLSDLVARGLFRADLYYRLSGVEIHVPPLRSRCEDVPEL